MCCNNKIVFQLDKCAINIKCDLFNCSLDECKKSWKFESLVKGTYNETRYETLRIRWLTDKHVKQPGDQGLAFLCLIVMLDHLSLLLYLSLLLTRDFEVILMGTIVSVDYIKFLFVILH